MSNDREDGARSAQTLGRGKDLEFQRRYGHGKQVCLGAPSADESSEDLSNDHNKGAHSATTTGRGKILAGKKLSRVLPTAKNRSTKSVPRDVGQCVYFDVFSTYAHHKLPNAEEFDEIKAAGKSVTINVTSQRSGSTNRMSQLNSEVSSWNTKRQIFPSSSTTFNESIGEDVLSSQSTYDVRFDNPHHIESIAPNPKVLFNSLPSNEDMKKSFEILVKAVNDMRIQSSSNNTLSAIGRNGRTFNTNIAEMHATRVCLNIDDVEFHEWKFTITTHTSIPLSIYDDCYTWAKYGRLILPEVFKLNEVQNSSILGMYRYFLCDFLRVDLEGNISKTLDVSMKSKLNEYLSFLFKGIS